MAFFALLANDAVRIELALVFDFVLDGGIFARVRIFGTSLVGTDKVHEVVGEMMDTDTEQIKIMLSLLILWIPDGATK